MNSTSPSLERGFTSTVDSITLQYEVIINIKSRIICDESDETRVASASLPCPRRLCDFGDGAVCLTVSGNYTQHLLVLSKG